MLTRGLACWIKSLVAALVLAGCQPPMESANIEIRFSEMSADVVTPMIFDFVRQRGFRKDGNPVVGEKMLHEYCKVGALDSERCKNEFFKKAAWRESPERRVDNEVSYSIVNGSPRDRSDGRPYLSGQIAVKTNYSGCHIKLSFFSYSSGDGKLSQQQKSDIERLARALADQLGFPLSIMYRSS